MSAREFGSLVTHFTSLEDPRLERTRKHSLLDIIAITICAVICGADSWVAVERYGLAKQVWYLDEHDGWTPPCPKQWTRERRGCVAGSRGQDDEETRPRCRQGHSWVKNAVVGLKAEKS